MCAKQGNETDYRRGISRIDWSSILKFLHDCAVNCGFNHLPWQTTILPLSVSLRSNIANWTPVTCPIFLCPKIDITFENFPGIHFTSIWHLELFQGLSWPNFAYICKLCNSRVVHLTVAPVSEICTYFREHNAIFSTSACQMLRYREFRLKKAAIKSCRPDIQT